MTQLKTFENIALERAFSNESPSDEFISFKNRVEKWLDSHERIFKSEAKGDSLEISIMDVIGGNMWYGGVNAKMVKNALDSAPNAKNITVLLDSPGGDTFDGVAIHSLLRRSKAHITIEILGEASSAASIIAMAGDTVKMHVGSTMMIHRAWTCVCGNSEELRSVADVLDMVGTGILDIYQSHNKKLSREDIEAKFKKETWMTASEAIKEGFADEVIEIVKPKASEKKTEPTKTLATKSSSEPLPSAPAPLVGADISAEDAAEALALLNKAKAERKEKALLELRSKNPIQAGIGKPAPPFGGLRH